MQSTSVHKKTRELSVIVPATNLISDVHDCLAALNLLREDVDLEVLLINRLGDEVALHVEEQFPWVKIVPVAKSTSIPLMRAHAFRIATKSVVAVIEDHVIVTQKWAHQLLDAFDEGVEVLGGSVENLACDKLIDWAPFLCEYSHLIPPIPEGSVDSLAGNNVAYKKTVLDRHLHVADEGHWEHYLHAKLKESGVELICQSDLIAGHKKHYTFWEYMSQRYLYARFYSSKRVAQSNIVKKCIYGMGSCILPPLLFYRIVTRIGEKKEYRTLLIKSLPLISLFVLAWAAGEVVGSLFGEGKSLEKVC